MSLQKRMLLVLPALITILTISLGIIFYARGYRYSKELGLSTSGLLIVKSNPESAIILLNGEEKGVTNKSFNLTPGEYLVSVEKEGFIHWEKTLQIKAEEVTEVTAHLFKTAPSLSAITFNGALNPVASHDFAKLAYIVLPETEKIEIETTRGPIIKTSPTPTLPPQVSEKAGLWVIEMLDLPLGFTREPKRIADGNLENASLVWSPNGREILLTNNDLSYLLDTTTFNSLSSLSVILDPEQIFERWDLERTEKLTSQIRLLPEEFRSIFLDKTSEVVFSPDEKMVMYKAKEDATLDDNIVKKLPGSSTQPQIRDIKVGKTYIYDIKEDRNFLIEEDSENLAIEGGSTNNKVTRRISWFPTSRNLILAEPNKISIMDYDGTNRQSVYSGSFVSPNAFPTVSLDRLMILTNLGSENTPANIYSLSVK